VASLLGGGDPSAPSDQYRWGLSASLGASAPRGATPSRVTSLLLAAVYCGALFVMGSTLGGLGAVLPALDLSVGEEVRSACLGVFTACWSSTLNESSFFFFMLNKCVIMSE
jgi:hypothetical protein